MSLYDTLTMLTAIQQMQPVTTFLRDRYAPTNPQQDIFSTKKVIVDYRKGTQKLAPVVAPRRGGITVTRDSFKTTEWEPPKVAPQRPLFSDDLQQRGFGEAFMSGLTPEQREGALLGQDLIELDEMTSRREEFMVAQMLCGNGYTLRQYADEYGGKKYEEFKISFFEGNTNSAVYAPAKKWNADGAAIYADLGKMVDMRTKDGQASSDLLLDPESADVLINDTGIQKLLDIRRLTVGDLTPQDSTTLPEGVAVYGTLSVHGHMLTIYSYSGSYTDESTKESKQFLPRGTCVVTAPASLHTMYGAVTQIEDDGHFHTYAGSRVPKVLINKSDDIRTLRLTSCPLVAPVKFNPGTFAQVL